MKWETSVSTRRKGELYIRGYALADLMAKKTWLEVVFLLLRGDFPSSREARMLETILMACGEHGVEVPSAYAARVSASSGNELHVALAAGILAVGGRHGGAVQAAMELLQSKTDPRAVVQGALAGRIRLPGFGHKIYKDEDPRAALILKKAKALKLFGHYASRALAIERELQVQHKKKIPLNIDGAMAAMLLELKFSPELGNAFFVLGRLPGMIAHAYEEMKNEKTFRRFEEGDVVYKGKKPRRL